MTFLSFLIWGLSNSTCFLGILISPGWINKLIRIPFSKLCPASLLPLPPPVVKMVCRSFSFIITAIYKEVFWFYDGPWHFNATVPEDFTFRRVFTVHWCYGGKNQVFLSVFMLAYGLAGWGFGGLGKGGKRLLGGIADKRLVSVMSCYLFTVVPPLEP